MSPKNVAFKATTSSIFSSIINLSNGGNIMKTNMQMLRNLIREEEENLDLVRFSSQEYLFNKVNEELSGKITILVDNTEKMLEKLKETEDLTNRINYLKRTLFEKENELRLEDGRTVKQASVENKYNLKLKYYYEALLRKENKKIRMTDSKSAYFLEYKLNIDRNEIKEKFMYSIECKTKVVNDEKIIGQVEEVCNALIKCYKEGHRVYMMGNGGSAADAQHFFIDFTAFFRRYWLAVFTVLLIHCIFQIFHRLCEHCI